MHDIVLCLGPLLILNWAMQIRRSHSQHRYNYVFCGRRSRKSSLLAILENFIHELYCGYPQKNIFV